MASKMVATILNSDSVREIVETVVEIHSAMAVETITTGENHVHVIAHVIDYATELAYSDACKRLANVNTVTPPTSALQRALFAMIAYDMELTIRTVLRRELSVA